MAAAIKHSSRYLAMESLVNIEKSQAYSNLELNRIIQANSLSRADAGLLTQLVYGVTQRKLSLDFYLEPFIRKDQTMEGWVKQLLRLSVYQALYLERIPDHAIIDEAVKIAKVRGHQGVANLVNAILRNFQRQELRRVNDIDDPIERLTIQYSLPRPILEVLIEDYGLKLAEEMAEAFLEPSYASVRVNQSYLTRDQALAGLQKEGFDVQASPLASSGIRAKKGHLASSSLFNEGYITIQDESSMLVAEALDVKASHQVLDACAAPGGKTTHIANYLVEDQAGKVVAGDIHDHKLKLIESNAKRQGFSSVIDVLKLDAKQAADHLARESFDRILVDAPCSGIGLLKRKPDIKYTKTKEGFNRLHDIQVDILEGTAPLLKKGGRLVYSTCTLIKQENEAVVDLFLSRHPDFRLTSIKLEDSVLKPANRGMIKILPQDYQTDGFFICALEKI